MPVSMKQNQQIAAVNTKERGVLWLDNVEKHWVRNAPPVG
jgi:hypothetical protein